MARAWAACRAALVVDAVLTVERRKSGAMVTTRGSVTAGLAGNCIVTELGRVTLGGGTVANAEGGGSDDVRAAWAGCAGTGPNWKRVVP